MDLNQLEQDMQDLQVKMRKLGEGGGGVRMDVEDLKKPSPRAPDTAIEEAPLPKGGGKEGGLAGAAFKRGGEDRAERRREFERFRQEGRHRLSGRGEAPHLSYRMLVDAEDDSVTPSVAVPSRLEGSVVMADADAEKKRGRVRSSEADERRVERDRQRAEMKRLMAEHRGQKRVQHNLLEEVEVLVGRIPQVSPRLKYLSLHHRDESPYLVRAGMTDPYPKAAC